MHQVGLKLTKLAASMAILTKLAASMASWAKLGAFLAALSGNTTSSTFRQHYQLCSQNA